MATKSYYQIALPCLLTGVISSIVLQRIGLKYFFGIIPPPVMTVITLLFFVCALLYILIFLRRSMNGNTDLLSLKAFWQDTLRYIIALDMSVFGICKFFGIQFNTPLALLDNPFNTLPDSDLMWAFFGHSYPYTILIGTLEIAGALMLIFKKTRLAGVFFLMPICLNIFILDIFYNGWVTAIYIAIEIVGLIYLLGIEYSRLVKFFFVDKSDLPAFSFRDRKVKIIVKLSVIVIPLMLMAINKYPQYYPDINGKYLVKKVSINGQQQDINCTDSALTKVYIDKNDLVFEYSNFKKRFIGNYKYNPATKQLTAIWRYPQTARDTLFARIVTLSGEDRKLIKGRMGNQSLEIEVLRVNKGN